MHQCNLQRTCGIVRHAVAVSSPTGGSSALEALAAGQRARLSLAHSQSTNRRSSMHLSQRHHSHPKLSLHGGSSGNSTGGGGAGGKARSARMSRAERIKSSLAGVVGVGAGPGGSSGGAEVQVQQEGDEDAEWGVTEGGGEGGDAEGPEGGATMYQHRSQAVSVMHVSRSWGQRMTCSRVCVGDLW